MASPCKTGQAKTGTVRGCWSAPEEGAWGDERDGWEVRERWEMRREGARCSRPAGERGCAASDALEE